MQQSQQQRPEHPATFNELLINEVRAHPQLYNQQHRVCTDNGERNVIWEVIAQRIDETVNGEFAKKRWLQMRDRYRKELKMALRTSVQPKWPYFAKLSWLDPYLKGAKKVDSASNSPLGQQNNLIAEFGIASKQQDFNGLNGIFGGTENNNETLMAASREFLERQQREKQENVSTSSAISNNDLNIQQLHNDLLSDNATIASSSANSDESIGDQQNNNSYLNDGNEDIEGIVLNGGDNTDFANIRNGNNGEATDKKQSELQSRSRLRNSPFMIRRGFVGDSKVTKNQQRGRSKFTINCNNKLSKIKKFDIASFCMNGNNNSNGVEDKACLEEIETATMLDEDEDEDCLFARLVVARLKNFYEKEILYRNVNEWTLTKIITELERLIRLRAERVQRTPKCARQELGLILGVESASEILELIRRTKAEASSTTTTKEFNNNNALIKEGEKEKINKKYGLNNGKENI
uniref:MADF domain-containing protein n=1 Tax=Meloidogyne javanica TaxID=6303 RepID=A0A915N5F9_MELJA